MVARTVSVRVVGDSSSAKKALDETGDHAEKNTGRIGGAFHSMLGQLNQAGVLGPFGEALSRIDESISKIGEHGKRIGAGLMVGGGAAAGVGLMFQGIASKDVEATNQLKTAIDVTGKSYEDYADKVEKAVKAELRHGTHANETKDALRVLTQATGDADKALEYLPIAAGRAADKHMDLVTAATQLGKTYNGSTKLLKEYHLEAGPKLTKALKEAEFATKAATAADDAAAKAKQKLIDYEATHAKSAGSNVSAQIALRSAMDAVAKAEQAAADGSAAHVAALDRAKQHLADTEARQAASSGPSAASQIGLRNAQDAVTASAEKAKLAHEKLTEAQDKATKAGDTQGDTMDRLGKILIPQANSAANTFSGHMRALKAEVEDAAAKFGKKYGPAITAAGAGMSALGAVTEIGAGIMGKFKTTQELGTVATEAKTAAEAAETPVIWASLGPILLIIAAVALLALGGYELVKHWKEIWGWVKHEVSDAKDWIVGVFNDFLKFMAGLPGAVGRFGEAIGKGLANGWIWGLNALIGAWDSLHFGIPTLDLGPLGKIGGGDFTVPQIPKIPYLDTGGIAYGPMVAALSQNNVPEAVTTPRQLADFAGYVGGGGGIRVEIPVILNSREVSRVIAPDLRQELNKLSKNSPTLPNL